LNVHCLRSSDRLYHSCADQAKPSSNRSSGMKCGRGWHGALSFGWAVVELLKGSGWTSAIFTKVLDVGRWCHNNAYKTSRCQSALSMWTIESDEPVQG
jgi:hypothetical protein